MDTEVFGGPGVIPAHQRQKGMIGIQMQKAYMEWERL